MRYLSDVDSLIFDARSVKNPHNQYNVGFFSSFFLASLVGFCKSSLTTSFWCCSLTTDLLRNTIQRAVYNEHSCDNVL